MRISLWSGQTSAGCKARAFLLGIVCAVAQLMIFRELMSSLYGNELVFAGLMAGWSAGIALGSYIGLRKINNAFLFLVAAGCLVLTVTCIHYLRLWLGALPGETLGVGLMSAVSFGVTLPFCFIAGALFKSMAYGDEAQGVLVYGVEALGFAAGGLLMGLFLISPFNRAGFEARAPQWEGYKVVVAQETVYASSVVVERGGEKSLFENGIHAATTGDLLGAEETVHYALLAHPSPKRLLMIGGALSGAVGEALKHPGLTVDCIERDVHALKVIRPYFTQASWHLNDPRVRLLEGDGRQAFRQGGEKYDVIIIAAGDPVTLLGNRYYTSESFREAQSALEASGILSFSLSASENYVNDQGRRMLAVFMRTLEQEFKNVKVIPGGRYIFLASAIKDTIELDAEEVIRRLTARSLQTQYVRSFEIKLRLDRERLRRADELLRGASLLNTDLRPFGLLASLAYYSTQTQSVFSDIVDATRAYSGILWLLPGIFFVLSWQKSLLPFLSVSAAGFSQISLQISMVILFQVFFGYVYIALGVLTGVFMLGIFAGSRRRMTSVSRSQCLAAGIMLFAAAGAFGVMYGGNMATALFFLIVPFLAGWSGGGQFSTALRLLPGKAGALYAVDVLATACGALLSGILLIPLWGVPQVLLFCAVLQLSPAFLWRSRE